VVAAEHLLPVVAAEHLLPVVAAEHLLPVAAVEHLLLVAAVEHHLLVAAAVHHLPVAVAELRLLLVYPNQGRQYWFWLGWAPRLCGRVANEKRVKLYSVNSNFY
jgi:hypothetical protein